jgi:hypothetical protein
MRPASGGAIRETISFHRVVINNQYALALSKRRLEGLA